MCRIDLGLMMNAFMDPAAFRVAMIERNHVKKWVTSCCVYEFVSLLVVRILAIEDVEDELWKVNNVVRKPPVDQVLKMVQKLDAKPKAPKEPKEPKPARKVGRTRGPPSKRRRLVAGAGGDDADAEAVEGFRVCSCWRSISSKLFSGF